MTQTILLADKDIETIITNIFMFEKAEERLSMLSRVMEDRKKDPKELPEVKLECMR